MRYAPHWLLIDSMLRLHGRAALGDGETLIAELARIVDAPADARSAPVLVVPGILPPDRCRHLIDRYEREGAEQSGFMREENGITVRRHDASHKRRSDQGHRAPEVRGDDQPQCGGI